MTIKFKVGFTISAETLFSIIAKFLPVEDLQVEEIADAAEPAKIAKVARLVHAGRLERPKRPHRNRYKGISLDEGANAVIMKLFSDGQPHRAIELKPLFAAAGFAETGIGSRLDKLRQAGVVHQPDFGLWQIGEAKKKTG